MSELHNYSHVERCTVQEYERALGVLCPDFVVWAETSKCLLIFLALGEKGLDFGLQSSEFPSYNSHLYAVLTLLSLLHIPSHLS